MHERVGAVRVELSVFSAVLFGLSVDFWVMHWSELILDSNFVFILELNVVDCVILCSMRESTFFFIYVQQIDQKRFEVHFYSFQVETFYVN